MEFRASDVSSAAIQVAQRNVHRHALENRVILREGALFSPLRNELAGGFDLIVSNPPYVKTSEIAKLSSQVKNFEPHSALDGG